MHVILTGATGLIGSGVLDAMIKMKDIKKISILSRRPVPMADHANNPRIHVIIHQDFETYDSELLDKLKGAKGCVWALGISSTQVGTEYVYKPFQYTWSDRPANHLLSEYIKITKNFSLAAARAFETLASPEQPFNFVYVSGSGANTEPGMFTQLFARVKGEVELALADMCRSNPSFHTISARPMAVDASGHAAIAPYIPTPPPAYRLLIPVLGPPVRTWFKGIHSPTEPLGRVLAELAIGKHEEQSVAGDDVRMIGNFPILENRALRRFAGL
jgi:hypothetical protein